MSEDFKDAPKPPPAEIVEPIGHDISKLSDYERRRVLEKVIEAKDEIWASEALELDQPFAPEEQERLVRVITDPILSSEVLSLDSERAKKLTPSQAEYLMTNVESDEESSYVFYLAIIGPGIDVWRTETERPRLSQL